MKEEANNTNIRFRLLEKIIVKNFITEPDNAYVKIAKYKDEYYLLEDPELYREKIESLGNGYYALADSTIQPLFYTVNDEKELHSLYINTFLPNTLNVFKVLLHYKDGKLAENLNGRLTKILEENKEIPDDTLLELCELLEEIADKKEEIKRIVLEPSILDAIKAYYRLFNEYKELLKELDIKDIIVDLTNETKDEIFLPTAEEVIAYIERFIEREERLRQRQAKLRSKEDDDNDDNDEEEKKESETQTQIQAQIQEQPISVIASTASTPTSSVSTPKPDIETKVEPDIHTPNTIQIRPAPNKFIIDLRLITDRPISEDVGKRLIELTREFLISHGYIAKVEFADM